MRKVILILLTLVSTSIFAQSDSTKSKLSIGAYVSASLSLTNGNDFKSNNYPSIEGGICGDNFGLGLVLGRGNLTGLGKPTDDIKNYFYETKIFVSHGIGPLISTVLFGYGGYMNTNRNFIEYGAGISYPCGKFSYGMTYSNWDQVNYITPSITFNF